MRNQISLAGGLKRNVFRQEFHEAKHWFCYNEYPFCWTGDKQLGGLGYLRIPRIVGGRPDHRC